MPDPLFFVDITAFFFKTTFRGLVLLAKQHTKPIKNNISETQGNLGLITGSLFDGFHTIYHPVPKAI